MGQVKDLILDNNRQLNLVVSRLNTLKSGMFLLKKLIKILTHPINRFW